MVSVTAMSLLANAPKTGRNGLLCLSLSTTRRSPDRPDHPPVGYRAMAVRPDHPGFARSDGAGQSLDLGHHPVQDLQPRDPETWVGDVHPDSLDQVDGPGRPAGGKKLEVVVHRQLSLAVALVHRQRAQVAEL